MTLRARIWGLLDPHGEGHAARQLRVLNNLINVIGLASVSVGTLEHLTPEVRTAAAALTAVVAGLFFVEYLVRLWIAPENPLVHGASDLRARLRWMVSIEGIIDLLAVIPALATVSGGARLGADSASV